MSLVQTLEWCDLLTLESSEEMELTVEGADIDPSDNLVTKAMELVGVDRARLTLTKVLPMAAGLGGGSSDAAAGLIAAVDHLRRSRSVARELAPEIGSDVPLFIDGGTQMMTGRGELLEKLEDLRGFALAVVVPEFELASGEVYERWDQLEGPIGEVVPELLLPPGLRDGMPVRNDLLPAAVSLAPELGDFIADLRAAWDTPVLMTGSGPACFGFFASDSEAEDAARSVAATRVAAGAALRRHGVAEIT
jgi:4-diphosphocytidyl-2-C-methyl-D-erythritol kinase